MNLMPHGRSDDYAQIRCGKIWKFILFYNTIEDVKERNSYGHEFFLLSFMKSITLIDTGHFD